jgi:hypothetical protein
MTRERTMWHQAGLTNPPGRIEPRGAYRQPASTQRYDRPAYRSGSRDRGRRYVPPTVVTRPSDRGRDQSRPARGGDRTAVRRAEPSQRAPENSPDRGREVYRPETPRPATPDGGRERESGGRSGGSRPGGRGR